MVTIDGDVFDKSYVMRSFFESIVGVVQFIISRITMLLD